MRLITFDIELARQGAHIYRQFSRPGDWQRVTFEEIQQVAEANVTPYFVLHGCGYKHASLGRYFLDGTHESMLDMLRLMIDIDSLPTQQSQPSQPDPFQAQLNTIIRNQDVQLASLQRIETALGKVLANQPTKTEYENLLRGLGFEIPA